MADAIRQRVFNLLSWPQLNQALGNLARDVSNALNLIPLLRIAEYTGSYTEPLYVGYDHEPKACLLVRVRRTAALETPVLCGCAVHFTWEPLNTRLRVTNIDGLTAGTTEYRFTFLMVG